MIRSRDERMASAGIESFVIGETVIERVGESDDSRAVVEAVDEDEGVVYLEGSLYKYDRYTGTCRNSCGGYRSIRKLSWMGSFCEKK